MDWQRVGELLSFGGNAQSSLLILGVLLVSGAAGGWLAERLHVPVITGNILAGVILGLTVFHDVAAAQILQPLSTFAICLIAVSAGGHFSYRRVHNAIRRILSIAGCEALGAVLLVFASLSVLGADWEVSLIMACLAAGTAPATTVALIRENRAKGPFVKTLLACVTVDSSLCILLFAYVHSLLAEYFQSGGETVALAAGIRHTSWILLGSVLLGTGLGFIGSYLFTNTRFHNFSTMVVAILFAAGVSDFAGLSPLLTCLIFGAYLGNSTIESEHQLRTLEPIEPLLYTAFFTLAGAAIHFSVLTQAGVLCLAYVAARAVGKGLGALLGGVISGSSPRLLRNIPFGFVPQAGVALGLVVLLEGDARIPIEFRETVGTLVLAAVTINEIIGPLFTRAALKGAQEAGLDRRRLVEFLQEEYIATNLRAEDKFDALRKLTNFYGRVHRVSPNELQALHNSIVDREKEQSTAIGNGAALPHGRVEGGEAIEGVLGIFPDGVDFGAPDGEPVNIVALIVTPHKHEQTHLEVLAALTAMIGDERVRSRLVAAVDPNDAWEIIESEESRGYNYFLEGNGGGTQKQAAA